MQLRLRRSETIASLPKRSAPNSRFDDATSAEAAFLTDTSEGDDGRRVAASEADSLRSIVNEYRASLLDDEDSIIGAAGTQSVSGETL